MTSIYFDSRSVAKDNASEHHLVLQGLIRHSVVKDQTSLLDLFLNETICATAESLSTLTHLLSMGMVKDEKLRCDLLRWCLRHISAPLQTSELVLALTTNQTPVLAKNYSTKTKNEPEYSEIYRALAFKDEIVKREAPPPQPQLEYDTEPQGLVAEVLLQLLRVHSESAVRNLEIPAVSTTSLEGVVNTIEVVLRILSAFWQISDSLKSELLTMVKRLLFSFTTPILNGKTSSHVAHLCHFYALDVHPELQKAVRGPFCTDPELISRLLARFQDLGRWKDHRKFFVIIG